MMSKLVFSIWCRLLGLIEVEVNMALTSTPVDEYLFEAPLRLGQVQFGFPDELHPFIE